MYHQGHTVMLISERLRHSSVVVMIDIHVTGDRVSSAVLGRDGNAAPLKAEHA
jgi:hypothetical protein